MLKLLPQRGVADAELQGIRVVHHGLQLIHAGRIGIGSVRNTQVFLARDAVVKHGVGQHIHEVVAPNAGARKLRVAVQLRILPGQAHAGLELARNMPVRHPPRLREVVIIEHVAQALVQLSGVAGQHVVGVLVRVVGGVADGVVALQYIRFGQGLGEGQVSVDAAAILGQRTGLVEVV